MAKSFGGSLKRLLSLMLGVALILGVVPGLGARVALALIPPLEKEDLVYTGEPLELVTAGSPFDGKTIMYSLDGVSFSTAIPKGTDAGEYSVTWAEYHSTGDIETGPKTILVTIAKADPVFTVPSFTVAAGSKLGDLAFAQPSNGTFEWQDDVDTSVGEVGETNIFRAKFTPKDTNNYNIKENVEVKVNVTSPVVPVTGVKLDKATATVEASKTVKLTATVEPADAMDKAVTWTSSDEKVATVEDGTVTAVAAGKATITASAGGKTATCEVTVTEPSKSYPAPTMSNSRGGAITSQSAEITYTISQKVPDWASSVRTWVDLESVLQYTTDASGVTVTCDGSDVEGTAVTIDGQRLTVEVADATSLRGKTVQIAYKAKLRTGADLTPYLNSAKTTASVPYQAHTVFDGDEANVVSSESESVKFQVGSSSGTTKTSTASTSKASTLAKTGDATSLTGIAATAMAGAGAVLVGRCRRR